MTRLVLKLILLFFSIETMAFSAQLSAPVILKKALDAERTARYEATAITSLKMNGKRLNARVRLYKSGPRTRFEYLSGPSKGIIITDDGRSLVTLCPRRGCTSAQLRATFAESLDNLLANYSPKLIGTDNVASRRTYVIELVPRAKGTPSSRIWIDMSTFVILGNERYSSAGDTISSTRFETVDYSARPPVSLFQAKPAADISLEYCKTQEEVQKKVGFTLLMPKHVPAGYALAGYYISQTPCGQPLAGIKYSNGLNTITVLEGDCPCATRSCAPRGRGQGCGGGPGLGACMLTRSAQARVFRNIVGSITVVVVGDAPDMELRKMAESFR